MRNVIIDSSVENVEVVKFVKSFEEFIASNNEIKSLKVFFNSLDKLLARNNLNLHYSKLGHNIFRFNGVVYIIKTSNMKTNKNEFKQFFTSKKIYRRIRKEKIVVLNFMKMSSKDENSYKIIHNVKTTIDNNSVKSYTSKVKTMRYRFND